jgi:hypothetical protein
MKRILFILLLIMSAFAQAETAVVVSKDSPISTLESQYIANIFLAKTNRYPNGEKARPVELQDESLRKLFYQHISGKSSKQLHAYWTTLVFTGKGKPPKGIRNNADLQKILLEHPGTISYIPLERVTEKMKVIYAFP